MQQAAARQSLDRPLVLPLPSLPVGASPYPGDDFLSVLHGAFGEHAVVHLEVERVPHLTADSQQHFLSQRALIVHPHQRTNPHES